MQDVRWDDLKVFLAVARTGSLQGAAEALGVSPDAVWKRVNALEDDLGVVLFDRDPKGYGPTPVGEAALAHAERLEEEVLGLGRTVTGHDREATGTVRFSMPESLLAVVAGDLAAFAREHPRIRVDLLLADRLVDLGRREADVALRPSLHPPEDAIGRRIATIAWAAYGPAGVEAEAAEALPWLAYGPALAHLAASRWLTERVDAASVLTTVNTVPGMLHLLATGCGRGALPCFVGDPEPRLGRLGAPIPEAATGLWFLLHADLRRTARLRALVDFLVPRLEALTPRFEGTA